MGTAIGERYTSIGTAMPIPNDSAETVHSSVQMIDAVVDGQSVLDSIHGEFALADAVGHATHHGPEIRVAPSRAQISFPAAPIKESFNNQSLNNYCLDYFVLSVKLFNNLSIYFVNHSTLIFSQVKKHSNEFIHFIRPYFKNILQILDQ